MPQLSKSERLVRKAEAALLSAIEVYNKPSFEYREETFAILALNAWELLLKAKVLAENGNDHRSLYVYERRQTKTGGLSRKNYLRRNRSGNVHTKGLGQVITDLDRNAATRLSPAVKANIDALTEIRDNAVHFVNASPQLAKSVLEIGTASVKNFIEISQRWFDHDLSQYNLFLMPIGFVTAPSATAIGIAADEKKLLNYLYEVVQSGDEDAASGFHVALEVNLSFQRSRDNAVAEYRLTDDPNAPAMHVREADIRATYPWDYSYLTEHLRDRYVDFKINAKYHRIRMPLKEQKKYCQVRYLDPGNPKSARKEYYNPNIVAEFDKHYSRK